MPRRNRRGEIDGHDIMRAMKAVRLDNLLDPRVIDGVAGHADAFAQALPFRHIVIDDFLNVRFAAELLADFPPFEKGNARNEAGALGGKSTIEKIAAISPGYAALGALIQSPALLDLIGRITGIDDLLYDPYYFGGGTHENRSGQDLDPHIDFNRHPIEHWHRRLNLIVYLNRDWHDDWGGALDLHSDPRSPDDAVRQIAPLFNRCVIFETTESSWHGFSRITIPADRAEVSRKSVALYFYTRARPVLELADTHSTIYVERALPDRFQAGANLDAADVDELRALLARRDQHIDRLYGDITRLTKALEQSRHALSRGLLGRLRYFAARMLARTRR